MARIGVTNGSMYMAPGNGHLDELDRTIELVVGFLRSIDEDTHLLSFKVWLQLPPRPRRDRAGPTRAPPHSEEVDMILRIDKLLTELPIPSDPSPAAAAVVQEVMGGKTGELSTLMNYLFQSNNFRGREAYRPYYDLVANIAAEEWGHVELVSHTINLLLTGATTRGSDPSTTPLADAAEAPYKYHYLQSGQAAVPADSMGNWWNGSYVTNTGNLELDLVHNFFLELGARATKMRVYESTSNPTARELAAFLLVRGSTHVIAFAKALEKLSGGVEVSKLFPIPELSTLNIPECRIYIEMCLYNTMYYFSPKDYRRLAEIWTGPHPDGAPDLVVSEDPIPTLAPPPPAEAEPQLASPAAPEMEPGFIAEVANRIFGSATT